ncbi:cullin-1-like isoform X2 [Lotus japonicus]|nr:cullin-1-like isoform X2 [Lotus japonicus]XP_057419998.1 cullin-1-like isoform X2 [Lotus japonicus]
MDKCEKISNSFEEGWPLLEKAVDSLINQIEEAANLRLPVPDYMSCYTTVYNMCTGQLGDQNCKLLYGRYKEVFETYINSTVLTSLQGKKDGLLLIELLRKWSNYKLMTKWLSLSFCYLNRYYIPHKKLTSTEETSFLMFYDLLHKKINVQVADAVTAMIDQGRSGEQIDRTLVNNTLAMYSEIGVILRINNANDFLESLIGERVHRLPHPRILCKKEIFPGILTPSSKKIRLVSSDGDVFEVDYGVGVGLMSKTIEDAIKTNPAGGTESILVYPVSSKILTKVIEICKKYTEASDSNNKEGMSGVDIKDWDAEFIDVDNNTLLHLHICAKFLNIKSLLHLTNNAIADKVKGKAPMVIRQMFNIKDNV